MMKVLCLSFFALLFNMHRESVSLPIIDSHRHFVLPRPLASENSITINGTMLIQGNILSVALLDKNEGHLCEFAYNTSNNSISIKSELPVEFDSEYYSANNSSTPLDFSLLIEPMDLNSIDFHINVNYSGSVWLPCNTKSFDNVNTIVVKGAETVNSLTFLYKH